MHRIPPEEDYFKDSTMTFGEHLEELRTCLFRALVGLVLCFLVALPFGGQVVTFIQRPLKKALAEYYEKQADETVESESSTLQESGYREEDLETVRQRKLKPERVLVNVREMKKLLDLETAEATPSTESASAGSERLVEIYLWRPIAAELKNATDSLNPQEPFLIFVKGAVIVGLLLSSPWIFYQIWSFVAAGLYPHEKKYVHVFLPFSVGLFLAGAAMAFFFVFKPVLAFLFMFNDWLNIDPRPRINEWLGFVLILPIGFGISFQLPLVMLFLERIGVFTVQAYLSRWRVAVLVIFVLAMFLTPADPGSMLLMAVPLTILYFGGVALCRYLPKDKSPYDDEE